MSKLAGKFLNFFLLSYSSFGRNSLVQLILLEVLANFYDLKRTHQMKTLILTFF